MEQPRFGIAHLAAQLNDNGPQERIIDVDRHADAPTYL
jgi:hypothetical protein